MKWYSYIICVILIFVGGLTGVRTFKDITAKSYVKGEISFENEYQQDYIDLELGSITLVENAAPEGGDVNTFNGATWKQSLLPLSEFKGNYAEYKVFINGYELKNVSTQQFALTTTQQLALFDKGGEEVAFATYNLEIFLNKNETFVKITVNDKDSMDALNAYYRDFGFHLVAKEIK